jgi:hypothetical protein
MKTSNTSPSLSLSPSTKLKRKLNNRNEQVVVMQEKAVWDLIGGVAGGGRDKNE